MRPYLRHGQAGIEFLVDQVGSGDDAGDAALAAAVIEERIERRLDGIDVVIAARCALDAADAEAICEAVRRPTMRFVKVKSAEQQGQLMQHRTRDVLIRQRTQIINALREHLAELGLVAAQGNAGVNELRAIVTDTIVVHHIEDLPAQLCKLLGRTLQKGLRHVG